MTILMNGAKCHLPQKLIFYGENIIVTIVKIGQYYNVKK